MSIHHEVTVHCDACGYWEQGNAGGLHSSAITRRRRKQGWLIWRDSGDRGSWLHLCPHCATDPEKRQEVHDAYSHVPIPPA